MTDKEIIKALECCSSQQGNCDICPQHSGSCVEDLLKQSLALINRQQAENKELKTENLILSQKRFNIFERIEFTDKLKKQTKAEAIKEFAERLKATPMRFLVEYVEYYDKPSIDKMVLFIDDNDIDNLVKEMAGEDK